MIPSELLAGKKAAIFDLDGTLIDSIGIWNRVDLLLLDELSGGRSKEGEAAVQARRDRVLAACRNLAGNPYLAYCRELVSACASTMSPERALARRHAIAAALLEGEIDFKPGMVAFGRALQARGMRLAIASTTNAANLAVYRTRNRKMRSQLQLDDVFELILTRDDVTHIKPDPEVYTLALSRLGVAAEEAIAFEDALVGVQAAKAAGLAVVAVYDRYSEADRVSIESLADAFIREV